MTKHINLADEALMQNMEATESKSMEEVTTIYNNNAINKTVKLLSSETSVAKE